jgi:glutaredoxin
MPCERVKAWLSRVGVEFVARNVMTDIAAYDAFIALGFRTVPLTVIDGHAVAGFKPEALAEALRARPGSPDRDTP